MRAAWFIGKFELLLNCTKHDKLFTQIPHTATAIIQWLNTTIRMLLLTIILSLISHIMVLYNIVNGLQIATTDYRLHLKSRAKFKLPTAQEWTLLSNTNPETGLPFNLLSGKNQVGKYLENIKAYRGDSVNLGEDGGFYTVRTDAYAANLFGLYNVIGNAAEMTDIKDVQKGGSWLDDLKDCTTDKVQTYVTPDPRVGFRVVMIINTR
jgi:hypothetical protein